MRERVFKIGVGDVKASVVLFDHAFRMQSQSDMQRSMAYITMLHQHAAFEMFFVPEGELEIVTESGAVKAGDSLIIVPPFLNHYTVPRSSEIYSFCFGAERDPRAEGGMYDGILSALSDGIRVFELSEDEKFYVRHIADAVNGIKHTGDTEHFLALLLSEIFSRIAPDTDESRGVSGKYGVYINTIDTYISQHYTENITLDDIAAELYLCSKQVSRIIKKEYGCSLSELVNRRRLSVACMLLKYTSLPISEISSTVGYGHENYFFTMFRKEYGITPKKYREISCVGNK